MNGAYAAWCERFYRCEVFVSGFMTARVCCARVVSRGVPKAVRVGSWGEGGTKRVLAGVNVGVKCFTR